VPPQAVSGRRHLGAGDTVRPAACGVLAADLSPGLQSAASYFVRTAKAAQVLAPPTCTSTTYLASASRSDRVAKLYM
jgi:hypothetical protein